MVKLDERISSLETKLKQLKTRQARLDARKRALASSRARKDDTRRKILVGAIVLTRVEQGQLPQAELHAWLDAALTRADDRALFDLPQAVSGTIIGMDCASQPNTGRATAARASPPAMLFDSILAVAEMV